MIWREQLRCVRDELKRALDVDIIACKMQFLNGTKPVGMTPSQHPDHFCSSSVTDGGLWLGILGGATGVSC